MYEKSRFGTSKLLPLHDPDRCVELPVNLAPNTTYARGRVLGHVANPADEVQTLTVTGGPTGGQVTVNARHPYSGVVGDIVLPYNASSAVAQAAGRTLFGPG